MKPTSEMYFKWMELFPSKDMVKQFYASRPVGNETRRQIEKQPSWRSSLRTHKHVKRLISPCGAVFVVSVGDLVVDVFAVIDPKEVVMTRNYAAESYLTAKKEHRSRF